MSRNKRGPGVKCANCGRINDYGERCECEQLEAEQAVQRQNRAARKRRASTTAAYETSTTEAWNEFYYA